MKSVAFIDLEIDPRSKKILDIGSIRSDGSKFHQNSIPELNHFLKGANFLCGHNILFHDLEYLKKELQRDGISTSNIIDTLFLSPLIWEIPPINYQKTINY